MELVLGLWAPRAQDATGLTPRGAQSLGEFPKRRAINDGARVGHAIETIGGNKLGVHGEGRRLGEVPLIDLLPHIPRDTLNGRLHFRYDSFRFIDAIAAALAEPFVLGNGANLRDVPVAIRGHESAVATHAA